MFNDFGFLNKLSAYSFLKQFEKRKYKVGRHILLEYLETIKTNKKTIEIN